MFNVQYLLFRVQCSVFGVQSPMFSEQREDVWQESPHSKITFQGRQREAETKTKVFTAIFVLTQDEHNVAFSSSGFLSFFSEFYCQTCMKFINGWMVRNKGLLKSSNLLVSSLYAANGGAHLIFATELVSVEKKSVRWTNFSIWAFCFVAKSFLLQLTQSCMEENWI